MAVRLSIRPSLRMKHLGSHWTDFHENLYLNIFRKSVEKIQVSLNSAKNNGYVTWKDFWYIVQLFLEWEMFQKNEVGTIKQHILFSITFFPNIVPFMR